MSIGKLIVGRVGDTLAVYDMPPESVRRAMCEWLSKHGHDPNNVCVPGWIKADADRQRVTCLTWNVNDEGKRYLDPATDEPAQRVVHAQLEGPPLPWPQELETLLRGVSGGTTQ